MHLCAGNALDLLTHEQLLHLRADKTALDTLEDMSMGDCLVVFYHWAEHTLRQSPVRMSVTVPDDYICR